MCIEAIDDYTPPPAVLLYERRDYAPPMSRNFHIAWTYGARPVAAGSPCARTLWPARSLSFLRAFCTLILFIREKYVILSLSGARSARTINHFPSLQLAARALETLSRNITFFDNTIKEDFIARPRSSKTFI